MQFPSRFWSDKPTLRIPHDNQGGLKTFLIFYILRVCARVRE